VEDLPHRTATPLGYGFGWSVLDWLTQTWFRFNIFIAWLIVDAGIAAAPAPLGQKGLALLLSPIVGAFVWAVWSLFLIVASFMPALKMPLGYLRLAYLRLFCRLIVQPICIETPVWF
jgi:hypothetical protein